MPRCRQRVRRVLQTCRDTDPQLVVTARTTLSRGPFETSADAPIVRALTAVTASEPTPAGVSYWADSAYISAAGIPTVLFGPDGEGAHAEQEWVSMSATIECARTLTALAQEFCGYV